MKQISFHINIDNLIFELCRFPHIIQYEQSLIYLTAMSNTFI
jgi:hypothetical protein